MIWTDTVTHIRRRVSGRDHYGNDVYAEQRETLTGVSWQTVDSSETHTQDRDQTLAHFRVYVRGFLDVAATDEFEHAGIRAAVHGRPEQQRSPTGRLTHTAIQLRETRG